MTWTQHVLHLFRTNIFLLNLIQNAFVNYCGELQETGLVKTGFINFDIRGFSEWEEPENKQSDQHFILFTF